MILSNLLIVPVEESLLYVQPIFVQGSAPNSFPLLQKVAVFYNDRVGYADTLEDAIREVVSGQPTPEPPPDGGAQPPPTTPPPAATVRSSPSSARPTRSTTPPSRPSPTATSPSTRTTSTPWAT